MDNNDLIINQHNLNSNTFNQQNNMITNPVNLNNLNTPDNLNINHELNENNINNLNNPQIIDQNITKKQTDNEKELFLKNSSLYSKEITQPRKIFIKFRFDYETSKILIIYKFRNQVYFYKIYLIFYFIVAILIFIFKAFQLVYPPGALELEIISLIIFLCFSLGILGNKTESSVYILIFLLYTILPLFGYLYYLVMQTYVLKIEIIFNMIGILFLILEVIFSSFAVYVTAAHEKTL